MGRIKRGGGDDGEPARSPSGWLELSPAQWSDNGHCKGRAHPLGRAYAPAALEIRLDIDPSAVVGDSSGRGAGVQEQPR